MVKWTSIDIIECNLNQTNVKDIGKKQTVGINLKAIWFKHILFYLKKYYLCKMVSALSGKSCSGVNVLISLVVGLPLPKQICPQQLVQRVGGELWDGQFISSTSPVISCMDIAFVLFRNLYSALLLVYPYMRTCAPVADIKSWVN